MFKTSFSFDGRIRRTEYGLSIIIYVVIYSLILTIGEYNTNGGEVNSNNSSLVFIITLVFIPLMWFLWAQGAKRCHDINRSGWWQLIPFFGLWMLFQEGTNGENDYGDDPKERIIKSSSNNSEDFNPTNVKSVTDVDFGTIYDGGHNGQTPTLNDSGNNSTKGFNPEPEVFILNSEPQNAQVYINNSFLGYTPLKINLLQYQNKEITLILENKTRNFYLNPNEKTYNIDFTKDEQYPIGDDNNEIRNLIIPIVILIVVTLALLLNWKISTKEKPTNELVEVHYIDSVPTEVVNTPEIVSISSEEASNLFKKMYQSRIEADDFTLNNVFASEVVKFYSLDNITKNKVIEEIKKYAGKFQIEEFIVESFSPTETVNQFNYSLSYFVRTISKNELKEYSITGEVGFTKEHDELKINYIKEIDVKLVSNRTSTIKIEHNIVSLEDRELAFRCKLVEFPYINNYKLIYEIYDLISINKEGWYFYDYSKEALLKAIENYKEYLKRDEERINALSTYNYVLEWGWLDDVSLIVFSEFNNLVTVQFTFYGGRGGVSWTTEEYITFDKKSEQVLHVYDILENTKNVKIWDNILRTYVKTNIFYEDLIPVSDYFYLDKYSMTFVYGKGAISENTIGIRKITVPFSEIKNYLKPEFINMYLY